MTGHIYNVKLSLSCDKPVHTNHQVKKLIIFQLSILSRNEKKKIMNIFPGFFVLNFFSDFFSLIFSGILIYAKSNFKTLWRSKLQYCKCRLDQALNDFVSHFIKARIYWKNNWIFASICSTNQLVIRDRFPSLWNAFEKKITEQQQWPRSSPFKNLRVVSLVKMFLEKYSNLQSK